MDDVNLARDLRETLGRLRSAGARIAAGAQFGHVLDALGEFAADKPRLQQSRAGEVVPASASVESIFLAIDEPDGTVKFLQMHFKEGVTLGAVQAELGGWYRDPPEPLEAAYTRAYFNPRLIDPAASFFVYALIDEWCDRFTPYTVVNSLNIDFSDRRQVTERPW